MRSPESTLVRPARVESRPVGRPAGEFTPAKAKRVGEPAVKAVVESSSWAISAEALKKQRKIPETDKRGVKKATEDAEVFTKLQRKLDRMGIKDKSTPYRHQTVEAKLAADLEVKLKTQRQESGRIPITPVKGIGNRMRQNKIYKREMKIAESDAAELAELLTKPEEQIKREAARRASREAMKERIKLAARKNARASLEQSKRGAKAAFRAGRFARQSLTKSIQAATSRAESGGRKFMNWMSEENRTKRSEARRVSKNSSELNKWATGQADAISKINASQPGEAMTVPVPGEINPTPSSTPSTTSESTPESVPNFSDSVAELNRIVGDDSSANT